MCVCMSVCAHVCACATPTKINPAAKLSQPSTKEAEPKPAFQTFHQESQNPYISFSFFLSPFNLSS